MLRRKLNCQNLIALVVDKRMSQENVDPATAEFRCNESVIKFVSGPFPYKPSFIVRYSTKVALI